MSVGVDRFVSDLADAGVAATFDGVRVFYDIVPIAGAHAGKPIPTGVSATELEGWPLSPPHWIHIERKVKFLIPTNTDQTDCLPGWNRQSRELGPWDTTMPAVRVWLAHVRGFLSLAA